MSQDKAIPEGSTILVTGANGYLASNIVDLLLQLGYNVRGTVRSEKPWLDEFFRGKYGQDRFESAIVPEMESEGAFDTALIGVAGVVHAASDVSFDADASVVIPKVVNGTVNLLKSSSKIESLKRFVLTSSSTAAVVPEPNKEYTVTDKTWNDTAVKLAWRKDTPAERLPYFVYAASKTEGERAAWKWVDENKPGFVFNALLPNINFGRILSPQFSGSTMAVTRNVLLGDDAGFRLYPPQWYVDVEDTARLHVIALVEKEVKSERIFAFAGPQNWTDVINVFHKLRPDNRLPEPPVNEGRDVTDIQPSKRAEQLLRHYFGRDGWTSLEDSLRNGIEGFAEG